jgi:hypothetical protein
MVFFAHRTMKAEPRLCKVSLSDQDRMDHIALLLDDLLRRLPSDSPKETASSNAAASHGLARKRQGYDLSMLVDDTRAMDAAAYEVVRHHLLDLNVSTLLLDLSRLNDGLESQLQESLQAFAGEIAA